MCFTPAISLSTAIMEFAIGILLITVFKKTRERYVLSLIVFLLGFYQFTEFMLCVSQNSIWAKLGFITYTFLPAAVLNLGLKLYNVKLKKIWIYILPIIFALFALLSKGFILASQCERFFVTVKTLMHNLPALFYTYSIYYFGFLIVSGIFVGLSYKKEKNKSRRASKLILFASVIITLLAALILLVIFPFARVSFPSVYCHFAMFNAVVILIYGYLESLRK